MPKLSALQKHFSRVISFPRLLPITTSVGVLATAAFLPASKAQGVLTNGATQAGTLLANQTNSWIFTANKGDSIVVRMGATVFTPLVSLYGPDASLPDSNSGAGSSTRDGETSFRATDSGPSRWWLPYILPTAPAIIS